MEKYNKKEKQKNPQEVSTKIIYNLAKMVA